MVFTSVSHLNMPSNLLLGFSMIKPNLGSQVTPSSGPKGFWSIGSQLSFRKLTDKFGVDIQQGMIALMPRKRFIIFG